MNAKIHIKQFLLSLVATTISIVLTFGTAAWIDGKKKEAARREMVMMILYDLSGSIEQAELCDAQLREGFTQQLAVASNPELLKENPFLFVQFVPYFNYTETVERIFSTNIETINTLGNVLFAENVSDIYHMRRQYKQEVSEKFMAEFGRAEGLNQYEQVMSVPFASEYIYLSGTLIAKMKDDFSECQQMMGVSDADLATYRLKREEMSQTSAIDSTQKALLEEAGRNYQLLMDAEERGKHL